MTVIDTLIERNASLAATHDEILPNLPRLNLCVFFTTNGEGDVAPLVEGRSPKKE
jgi:hypothetical protein